jgi:hypothetical protein
MALVTNDKGAAAKIIKSKGLNLRLRRPAQLQGTKKIMDGFRQRKARKCNAGNTEDFVFSQYSFASDFSDWGHSRKDELCKSP